MVTSSTTVDNLSRSMHSSVGWNESIFVFGGYNGSTRLGDLLEFSFLTKSCVETKETIKWEDGTDYPLFKLDISHKSHPFFTGQAMFIDTAGRIDKFKNKYAKFSK